MPALNIRNVPEKLQATLKKASERHGMTMRGTIIKMLTYAIGSKNDDWIRLALPDMPDLDEDGEEVVEAETVDPTIEKVAAQKLRRKEAVIKGDPKYVDAGGTYCGPLPGQDEVEWEIENEAEIMGRILIHERLQVERETAQIEQNGAGERAL